MSNSSVVGMSVDIMRFDMRVGGSCIISSSSIRMHGCRVEVSIGCSIGIISIRNKAIIIVGIIVNIVYR